MNAVCSYSFTIEGGVDIINDVIHLLLAEVDMSVVGGVVVETLHYGVGHLNFGNMRVEAIYL